MNSPLLNIKNLKTYFYDDDTVIPAVDGVDLTINEGETLAVVGESGCGKSVTSLSIMGLIPTPPGKIVDGNIIFKGTDLVKLTDDQMNRVRGNEISMIFQEPMTSLNPVLRIGEQIMETIRHHQKMNKTDARRRAVALLKEVGFPRAEEIIDEYPHQLSGGMRQRVMIAMALACNPELIIADEPTTALDVTIQAQILELMKSIKDKMNTSIMLITHDLGVVAEMADRVAVMYAGQVVEEAPVDEIFESPSHPYTRGLMKSVPNLAEETGRLYSIKGSVPTADQMPSGCRFAPRCEFAQDKCRQSAPELEPLKSNHKVRCFLAKEGFLTAEGM